MQDNNFIRMGNGWKTDTKNFQKASTERDKVKYYCSCGHSSILPYNVDKKECSWCHKMIYKKKIDEKRYFKDKMRQLLNQKEE